MFFIVHLTLFLTSAVADEAIGLTWVTAIEQFRNTALMAYFDTWQEQNVKTMKTCFQIF